MSYLAWFILPFAYVLTCSVFRRYLGAMAGTDGHVYCFPSGSERVLQVDTGKRIARSVGPNLRDEGMESMHQIK